MRKATQTIFSLFLSQLFFAKPTFITGHFDKPGSQSVIIQYYASPLSYIEDRMIKQELTLDDKSNFRFEIETDNPIQFNLLNGDKWLIINKYALAGDSLYFDFKEKQTKMTARCEECLAFNFEWEDKFMADPQVNKEYNSSYNDLEPSDFSLYWSRRKKDQLYFFENFFKNKKLPDPFQNVIEAEVNYNYALAMLNYSWRKKTQKNVLIDPTYLKFMDSISINNPPALVSGSYIQFLRELPFCMYLAGISQGDTIAYTMKNQIHLRDSIAKTYFKDGLYDLALYHILYEAVKTLQGQRSESTFEDQYRRLDTLLQIYTKQFNNKFYTTRLTGKFNELKNPYRPAPDFILKDIHGKEVKFSDFKGKVIYLDFWATNCAPCIKEVPHANKLKETFKGKDVVFLYVSFDLSTDKLKKFIEARSFDGIHLTDPKGFASDVAELYEITSLPHYFLIDKNGVIINSNAPRPSLHPENLIERALK